MSNGTHASELERLVEQYQTAVLRTCYLYLCDRSQAEDAVQETFLKVYKGLDTFRGESSEKTWVMKIAMNTCYKMNHSGWSRFINRRVTPEMLPETSVPFEEKDGLFYSPGVTDDTGNLASLLVAVRYILQNDIDRKDAEEKKPAGKLLGKIEGEKLVTLISSGAAEEK